MTSEQLGMRYFVCHCDNYTRECRTSCYTSYDRKDDRMNKKPYHCTHGGMEVKWCEITFKEFIEGVRRKKE